MTKVRHLLEHDQHIIDALEELPKEIVDRKHNLIICLDNNYSRNNETRFEHIAKKYHELKVRDIKAIPEGIIKYVKFEKSKEHKETFYYFISRKGEDTGFIQVAVKLYEHDKKRAYVKTIYITHRPNWL